MPRFIVLCRKCDQPVPQDGIEIEISRTPAGVFMKAVAWCDICQLNSVYTFKAT